MIPNDAVMGVEIRWVGEPFRDKTGATVVKPGEVGTFITFHGPPGHPEVVVSFPALTFVTPQQNVELTA